LPDYVVARNNGLAVGQGKREEDGGGRKGRRFIHSSAPEAIAGVERAFSLAFDHGETGSDEEVRVQRTMVVGQAGGSRSDHYAFGG
jgi:hypothetical protein